MTQPDPSAVKEFGLRVIAGLALLVGAAGYAATEVSGQPQALVVVIGAVAYYFAVVFKVSLVRLLLGSYGGVAQIFPLMFAAFYWPRATGAGALAGLLAGIGVNTLFLLAPEWRPFPLHEGIYGLIANVAVFVAVSLATKPEPMEKLRAYMGTEEEITTED